MAANPRLQLLGGYTAGIEAGDEIAAFARENLAFGRAHGAIDADQNLAIGDA